MIVTVWESRILPGFRSYSFWSLTEPLPTDDEVIKHEIEISKGDLKVLVGKAEYCLSTLAQMIFELGDERDVKNKYYEEVNKIFGPL